MKCIYCDADCESSVCPACADVSVPSANMPGHGQLRRMEQCGVILYDPQSGRRATLDKWGRVQWWHVDASGIMSPTDNTKDQRT